MKCYIGSDGCLFVTPENSTEKYALSKWWGDSQEGDKPFISVTNFDHQPLWTTTGSNDTTQKIKKSKNDSVVMCSTCHHFDKDDHHGRDIPGVCTHPDKKLTGGFAIIDALNETPPRCVFRIK